MKLYKLAFYYSSFNTGYSLTSPIKWVAGVFGIGAATQGNSLYWILLGAFVYFVMCIIVGIICYKFGWVDAVSEVGNKYNPFVKEVREKLETKTI